MKTHTEFSGIQIKGAVEWVKAKKAALASAAPAAQSAAPAPAPAEAAPAEGAPAEGQEKPADAAPAAAAADPAAALLAAAGEHYKLEGEKLKWFLAAVETAKSRLEGLKRVVVLSFAEGEKVPSGTIKQTFEEGEKHFVLEFFPVPQKAGGPRDGRDGRRGGRDKGGKRGGRGGGRGGRDRDGRPGGPGGDRGPGGGGRGPGGGERRDGRPGGGRGPRGPQAQGSGAPKGIAPAGESPTPKA